MYVFVCLKSQRCSNHSHIRQNSSVFVSLLFFQLITQSSRQKTYEQAVQIYSCQCSVFLSLSPTQNSTYFSSSLFPVIYMYSSCKINDNTGNKEGCRRMCCKRCGIFAKYCGRAIFGHFDVLNKLLLKVEKKMSGCKRKHSRQDEKV